MIRKLLLAAASTALLSTGAYAQDVATAEALRDKALKSDLAWEITEELTDMGPRLVGSPAMERAKDWGVAKLKAMGFTNVVAEEFAKPSWTRGEEWAEITAPYPQKLSIIGLGRTISTPAAGIEAEVVLFKTYNELLAAPAGSLKGKIAFVNEPMTRAQDGAGYGPAGAPRRGGPAEAAKRGAVALLIRSVSTSTSTVPHTGSTAHGTDAPNVPAAALGVPEADLLQRLALKGPVKVKLKLVNSTDAKDVAWNVAGEIRGSEKPDEIIVIGGHLDSWDVGTGALDDATGVAITTAAAKLIAELPKRPKRTIRVVMWGSEESGGSSDAYLAAHKNELSKIVLAGESDTGADRIYALALPQGSAEHPVMKEASRIMTSLKIYTDRAPSAGGGADISGIERAGVPVINLHQDASRYFDFHHTADDTLDKVDPAQLAQNVAAWTSFLYLVADSDIDFRALGAAAK